MSKLKRAVPKSELVKRLPERMEERGITQEQLAEKLGMKSSSHISRIISGKNVPSIDLIEAIYSVLGYSVKAIKDEDDNNIRGKLPARENR